METTGITVASQVEESFCIGIQWEAKFKFFAMEMIVLKG